MRLHKYLQLMTLNSEGGWRGISSLRFTFQLSCPPLTTGVLRRQSCNKA